jgi:geranylgeranyl diphosphate synthase type II
MVDAVLERVIRDALVAGGAGSGTPPPRLGEALEYAVFPAGGRVRPRLCLEVARACGTADELAYAAACSVELLHCASLVHDDLPCFDGASTRRGRPSVHNVYGEAMAVLVGDGLMTQAFHVLARGCAQRPAVGMAPVLQILEAAGPRGGLVAGQAWELEKKVDVAAYHRAKTASLFEAAATLGALVNSVGPSPFATFGRSFGMAYQLADDVADVLADAAALGKPTGRDRDLGRPTAVPDGMAGDAALTSLAHAGKAAVDVVPMCDGEGDLRRFTEAVFEALMARCRHPRSETSRLSA